MRKKILKLCVLFFIVTLSLNIKGQAEGNDWSKPHKAVLSDEEISALSNEEREQYLSNIIYATGYIDDDFITMNVSGGSGSMADFKPLPENTKRPSKFDPRSSASYKLPAIRNQNPYGTCWAHATCACMEIDLIKNHKFSNTINLSELQLAYFAYHSANDPLGNLKDDKFNLSSNYLDFGGNFDRSYNALANWSVVADENDVPELKYSNASKYYSKSIPSKYAYKNNKAHMEGFYYISEPNAEKGTVKDLILKYGAVQTSYCSSGSFYNSDDTAFYCPTPYQTNHAVTIVGWDDNYSTSHFGYYKPSKKGAWLIRNSWGTWFGDNGYFWISYEDKSMKNAVAYDAVPVSEDHDNIYQYDNSFLVSYAYSSHYGANVFTAKAEKGKAETLERISTYIIGRGAKNPKVTVKIYKNLTGTAPDSGTLAFSKVVEPKLLYEYNNLYIDVTGVKLNYGEKFSVVIGTENCYLGFDYSYDVKPYNVKVKAHSGESFYNYGYGWQENSNNYKIKAYTDSGSKGSGSSLSAFKLSKAEPVSNGMKLTWAKSSGAKNYIVYRKEGSGSYKKLKSVSKTTYTDKSAKNGKTYTYKIVAANGSKTKDSKNTIKKLYLSSGKVSSLKNSKKGKLIVKFTKNSEAKGYEVMYSTSSNFTKDQTKTVKISKAGTTSATISVKKGTKYYIRVRSFNGKNYSAWSGAKSIKILK